MPPLPDDHDDKWVYQMHTRAKHEALRYYLDVWTSIVSHEDYTLRVYDCFAGRGDYETSDGADPMPLQNIQSEADFPGSPQIMLDVVSKYEDHFDEAEIYLLEPNDNNRKNLKKNLDTVQGVPDNVTCYVANKKFEDITEVITSRGFGLFFIDPFGFGDLDYDIVSKITNTDRFDCLITLMTKELIRWQDSDSHNDAFQTLYGTPNWREELKAYEANQLETAEAEYYCHRLEEGGTEYTLAYMTTRGDSIELMYDLICTTNNKRGLEAMKESMVRCGADYALAYAPERSDIGGREQTTLTGGKMLTEEDTAKSYLITRFAGQKLEFDEVVRETLQDPDRRYARSLKKDYRDYLKELDNEGEIEIPSRNSEDGALKGDYTIRFPETDQE